MERKTRIGAALKDFQAREVDRILSACTSCGKCYEVCPMARYSAASESDGKAVVAGVLGGRWVVYRLPQRTFELLLLAFAALAALRLVGIV